MWATTSTNELSWQGIGPDADIGLALGTLKATAGQPAKTAFVAELRQRYGDIQRLNGAWQSQFRDWNELNGPWNPVQVSEGLRRDCRQFVQQFARQYFRVVSEHVKAHDPNHLYLGCRFSVHTADIVRAAAEYCDVISFNIYTPRLEKTKWAYLTTLNKPCLVSEFHVGATDRGMFGPGLVSAPDQATRAKTYGDYVTSVLDHPAMVGCHWFQYMDEPATGRVFDGENFGIGFVSVTDNPYAEMVAAARDVHRGAYARRFGKLPAPESKGPSSR